MTHKTRKLLLPDEKHSVVIWDYSMMVICTVMDNHSLVHKQDFKVNKTNPQWNDLVHQFCELARRKYPREIRHKSISIHRQRAGF